jgi:hypothetical protein
MPPSLPLTARHVRLSALFEAGSRLELSLATIRRFPQSEATDLHEFLRRRNAHVRHAPERDFYASKVSALSDETVIVLDLGPGPHPVDEVREMSFRAELVAFTASALWLRRRELQKALGTQKRTHAYTDLYIEGNATRLSSNTKTRPSPKLLLIDEQFVKRFERNGFTATASSLIAAPTEISRRIAKALDWLGQARLDPDPEAALVKTVTGIEALLILGANERIQRNLVSRTASLLATSQARRQRLRGAVKALYDCRCCIVHGGRNPRRSISNDVADKLLLLTAHALAARNFTSARAMREALDSDDGSQPRRIRPFPLGVLTRLDKAIERELAAP